MVRKKIKRWKKLLAVSMVALLAVGGVAFALLQSHADLTGNSIQTDSAGLMISRDTAIYSVTANGYAFTHIIPGYQASQAEPVFLENTGSSPLALRLGASNLPANPDNIDLSKVDVVLTPRDSTTNQAGTSQSFPLQSLIDSPDGMPINLPAKLAPSGHQRFDIQVSMDADAVNGTGAALANMDLKFTGVGSSTE